MTRILVYATSARTIERLDPPVRRRGSWSGRLLSADARDMVRVREARGAFRDFYAQCFWYLDPTCGSPSATFRRSCAGCVRTVGGRGSSLRPGYAVEWAQDSAFRFYPLQQDERFGYRLHDTDAAVNKVLALAGRSEIRDFVDVLLLPAVAPLRGRIGRRGAVQAWAGAASRV